MIICIIGSGLAGLLAAYISSFCEEDQIFIVEKNKKVGGNSSKASSGINFLEPNTEDSKSLFISDTLKAGKYHNNQDLVDMMVSYSTISKVILEKLFNIKFNTKVKSGGHSVPRTYSIQGHPKGNIGNILISTIYEYIKKRNNINLLFDNKVTDFIIQDNKIYGIVCNNKFIINCQKVIIAAGGYGNSKQLVKYGNFPTTNNLTATGDIIITAKKKGILVKNLNDIQIHPTAFIDPDNKLNKFKFLAPEALRGHGGILVDKNGKQFVDNLETRDRVTNAILYEANHVQGCPNVLLICGKNIENTFGIKKISFYGGKKLMKKMSIEEISDTFQINKNTLRQTLSNFSCNSYYVSLVTPAIHYTMGGIVIDGKARVYDVRNKLIKGLYAVGEVTTGVHGKNRLCGNSLLECVVFAIQAAKK